jgi:hypothetical protein
MIAFIHLKNTLRQMHADFGAPISSREAHRIAQGVMLTQCAEQFANAAEAYFRQTADPTGEEATNNVLIQYLIDHGSLTAAQPGSHQ